MAAPRGKGKPPRQDPETMLDEEDTSESAGLLPDLMRRVVGLGLSGFFTTEEAVRKALGDTVPRDLLDFAVDQGERTRADFIERLAREIARNLGEVDLEAIVERALQGHTLQVEASIRFVRKDSGSPSGRALRVRVDPEDGAES